MRNYWGEQEWYSTVRESHKFWGQPPVGDVDRLFCLLQRLGNSLRTSIKVTRHDVGLPYPKVVSSVYIPLHEVAFSFRSK